MCVYAHVHVCVCVCVCSFLFQFPGTAVTKHHRLGGLGNRNYCLTVMEAGHPRLKTKGESFP